jgi:hypothetical protein
LATVDLPAPAGPSIVTTSSIVLARSTVSALISRHLARAAGIEGLAVVHSIAVGEPNATVGIAGDAPPGEVKEGAGTRWKTFADVVAFTLGVNVWISIIILPAAFIGALHGGVHVLAALLPFGVLVAGLVRRSEVILLGFFPAAIMVPVILQPTLASQYVYGPVRFILVALGLVAYLFGVSFFTTFHEPPAPRSVRGLSSAAQAPAPRWRRRERVYWMLVGLAAIFPTLLIAWVNYDTTITDYLGEMYPGRVALMTTALTVGAIVLWLVVFHYAFLGVLRPHRTGDRDLVAALGQARADAKAGKPRGRFYLAVGLALAAMIALVILHRGAK